MRQETTPLVRLVLVGSFAASAALAQQSPHGSQSECLARLPANAFSRVPVYLAAAARDSQSRSILPGADLLTQLVAFRLRAMLGAGANELPSADSVLAWHELDGTLSLTVYPDGRFSWTPIERTDKVDPFFHPSTALLERALSEIRDEGERVFTPDGVVFDSMAFDIHYVWPHATPERTISPVIARVAIPVFSLNVPWEKPAFAVRQPRVLYPEEPRQGFAEGSVLLQFVVDTTGRAQMSTLRELGNPRLTGELAAYYRAFVAAAINAVKRAEFAPAEVGGCRVRQLVQLPFAFKLRR